MKKFLPIIVISCFLAGAYPVWMYGEAIAFNANQHESETNIHESRMNDLDEPVEIIEKRTQNSKTHFLGFTEDGRAKYSWDGTIGAIHYKDNPDDPNEPWKEINTTITDNEQLTANNEQYDWGMEKAGYHAYFKENFNADKIVKFEKQGEWLKIKPGPLQWTGNKEQGTGNNEQLIALPGETIATVNENKIYWKDAYGPNLDFEWLTYNTRLEKHLIIKNFEDLPKPENLEEAMLELNLAFEFSDGVTMEETEKGTIKFKNKDGEVLWGFLPLRYWDSSEPRKERVSKFNLSSETYNLKPITLSIRVPYDWLQSAVHPVFIDTDVDEQIIVGADDGADTMDTFSSGAPWDYIGYDDMHTFHRWPGVTIEGTIGVSYIEIEDHEDTAGSPEMRLRGVDEDNPVAPTTHTEFDNDPLTDAEVEWDEAFSGGGWKQSPSLNTIFQELVNSYTISDDAVMIQIRGNIGSSGYNTINTEETLISAGAKLHIEYTAEGPTGYEMASGSYRIWQSSINVGGHQQTSTSYKMRDTIGEFVVGTATSTSYKLRMGYQPMQEVYLSLALSTTSVSMSPDIGGITGGTSTGSVVATVTTDDPAGYSLSLNASTDPAMQYKGTIDKQVAANLDDAMEDEDDGNMWAETYDVRYKSDTSASERVWGAHRWVLAIPKGSTISVCYVQLYIGWEEYDDANVNLHFEKAASPISFTDQAYNITNRTRTNTSTSWIQSSLGENAFKQTPSLVTPLQEVVTAFDVTAVVCIFRPNTDYYAYLNSVSHENEADECAKLHIEYTDPNVNFADYTPTEADPDYDWGITTTDSEFGFTPYGTDTVQKYQYSGTTCNQSGTADENYCWYNFSTSTEDIAQSTSSNHPSGAETTIKLQSESGTSNIQESGEYQATITVTAVAK